MGVGQPRCHTGDGALLSARMSSPPESWEEQRRALGRVRDLGCPGSNHCKLAGFIPWSVCWIKLSRLSHHLLSSADVSCFGG